jgi:hypothetical protein
MSSPDDPASAGIRESVVAPVAGSGVRWWTLALAAGLLAGVISWAIGEATLVPEATHQDKKAHIYLPLSVAGIHNGTLSFAALGAAIGLALGIAGGLIGRSTVRAGAAGATGLLLGGTVGISLSRLILPIYYQHSTTNELIYSFMVHGGIWTAIAAVAGLAFGIGVGGWRAALRGMLGSACAALLAAIIYEVAGGILFPAALTDRPLSQTGETRLMARLLVTVLAAAGAVLSIQSAGSKKAVDAANSSP